jgi:hypothetical protein
MDKKHIILLAINLAFLIGFGFSFLMNLNYEFLVYVGVIIFFLVLIGLSLRKVDYTFGTLVGLTLWSALHLAGGGIYIGEERLYDIILFRISDKYPIWRYDQLVHIWGFGASTLLGFSLLRKLLVKPVKASVPLSIILIMTGLGFGALNEILEFIVSQAVPESGVGGYINTSLDLCSNLIGAILALIYIKIRYLPKKQNIL